MRLSRHEHDVIVRETLAIDPRAQVYLFGSRVDDARRGGDIDILILSEHMELDDKMTLRMRLCDALGEQKFDLVIAKDLSSPFVRLAHREGIRL